MTPEINPRLLKMPILFHLDLVVGIHEEEACDDWANFLAACLSEAPDKLYFINPTVYDRAYVIAIVRSWMLNSSYIRHAEALEKVRSFDFDSDERESSWKWIKHDVGDDEFSRLTFLTESGHDVYHALGAGVSRVVVLHNYPPVASLEATAALLKWPDKISIFEEISDLRV